MRQQRVELTLRIGAQLLGCIGAAMVIFVLWIALPKSFADVILDASSVTFPVTIQTVMWVVFFMGFAELALRLRSSLLEENQLRRQYLPEDTETLLRPGAELQPIYRKVRGSAYRDICYLPRLITRCVLQYNTTKSVDQTNSILNSSLDLFIHEVDLRYNILRYITWLIPSLGFIGTVYGIMLALQYAGVRENAESPDMLYEVTSRLGVAFSTTLVALLMAAVLVFSQNVVQAREERSLNQAGQYCLDNLINRLYAD